MILKDSCCVKDVWRREEQLEACNSLDETWQPELHSSSGGGGRRTDLEYILEVERQSLLLEQIWASEKGRSSKKFLESYWGGKLPRVTG